MISMRYEKVLLPTFQELVNMRSRGIDMRVCESFSVNKY